MLLQFSSAQGPEECCIAVEKTLNYFLTVTEQRQVDVIILEQEPSHNNGQALCNGNVQVL